jgi:hypothetical protein
MGIAAEFDGAAACGITRVVAVEDVDDAIETFTHSEAEDKVIEFSKLNIAELPIID